MSSGPTCSRRCDRRAETVGCHIRSGPRDNLRLRPGEWNGGMNLVVAVVLVVGGLALSIWASNLVVLRAERVVSGLGIPPFVVGMILFAIGTDLPEIANSVVAAASGHGDLVIGNATGSALVQSTFVLGVLALISRRPLEVPRRDVVATGVPTVAALLTVAVLAADGRLARMDGLILVALWIGATVVAVRIAPPEQLELPEPEGSRTAEMLGLLGGFVLVAGGAVAAVEGFADIAEILGVPEIVVGFLISSVGTSLPELVVNGQAVRKGEATMAVGGVVGASLLDSTLTPGLGPLVAPIDVSAGPAVSGSLWIAGAIAIATAVLARRGTLTRWGGGVLLLTYGLVAAQLA